VFLFEYHPQKDVNVIMPPTVPELVTYIFTTATAMLQKFTHNDVESGNVRFAGVKLVEKFTENNACDVMLHHADLMSV